MLYFISFTCIFAIPFIMFISYKVLFVLLMNERNISNLRIQAETEKIKREVQEDYFLYERTLHLKIIDYISKHQTPPPTPENTPAQIPLYTHTTPTTHTHPHIQPPQAQDKTIRIENNSGEVEKLYQHGNMLAIEIDTGEKMEIDILNIETPVKVGRKTKVIKCAEYDCSNVVITDQYQQRYCKSCKK